MTLVTQISALATQVGTDVAALQTTVDAKAEDNEVVKLTGNQTVAGTKTFSSTVAADISGNAATATTLATARTISATGDATWSVSFNGSGNASGTLTLGSGVVDTDNLVDTLLLGTIS